MESDSGSQEPQPSKTSLETLKSWHLSMMASPEPVTLTEEEQDRIADGEPYCFRCGRPASSFPEYCGDPEMGAVGYVKSEEGTYNPDTNRFACDGCYIAIGMPAGEPGNDYGWRAL